jgi:ligand-binding SRPBCC domain-containing protein
MGHLVIVTHIEAPIERCFDAARSLRAHAESAKFSHETLVEPGKLDGHLELGDLVCFEGRHFGMRQRFCARIIEIKRPTRFVDEMVRGVFKSLRHVHEFEESDGRTKMTDTLEWQAPLGILGRIADALFLERHMRWFVGSKQTALKGMLESGLV